MSTEPVDGELIVPRPVYQIKAFSDYQARCEKCRKAVSLYQALVVIADGEDISTMTPLVCSHTCGVLLVKELERADRAPRQRSEDGDDDGGVYR